MAAKKFKYALSPKATTLHRRDEDAVPPREPPEPGSFEARVSSRRVDLVRLVERGLPPLIYVAASEGMLVKGKRHLLVAPMKDGKSISTLNHLVDVVLEGDAVAILDRENGSDTYARRLADIFTARDLSKVQLQQVRRKLVYYEFPQFKKNDADNLVAEFADFDLVVFDSQRMFLSDFNLKESDSDDYALFMRYAIDPLFQAGTATLILDNAGHDTRNQNRSRGTSAKGDLNEIMFSLAIEAEFGLHRAGRVRLKVEKSRFGNWGEWTMEIGGGQFGRWTSTDLTVPNHDDFREGVLAVLEDGKTLGVDKLIKAVRDRGVKIGTTPARALLVRYAEGDDGAVLLTSNGYKRGRSA